MTHDTSSESLLVRYASGKLSRAQLLKAIGLGAAAAAMPGVTGAAPGSGTSFPFFPQIPSGTYTTESVQDIVSNMLTHEYLHLEAGLAVLSTPALATKFGITSGVPLAYFQSFVAIHQYQIDFWSSLVPAAMPVATSFTIDPKLLADAPTFLAAGELVDTLRVATDIAAVREFAELGQPTLAKYAAQTLGTDAEMRVSIRYLGALSGVQADMPPTNKAFETDLLLYTRDGIAILKALGLIGGTGIPVSYPGRDAVLSLADGAGSAVIQKAPNNATTTVAFTGVPSILGERS